MRAPLLLIYLVLKKTKYRWLTPCSYYSQERCWLEEVLSQKLAGLPQGNHLLLSQENWQWQKSMGFLVRPGLFDELTATCLLGRATRWLVQCNVTVGFLMFLTTCLIISQNHFLPPSLSSITVSRQRHCGSRSSRPLSSSPTSTTSRASTSSLR